MPLHLRTIALKETDKQIKKEKDKEKEKRSWNKFANAAKRGKSQKFTIAFLYIKSKTKKTRRRKTNNKKK